jgi:hypothetical protein
MHQQLWGYKVEEKLYVGVREQKRLNTAGLDCLSLFVGRSLWPVHVKAGGTYGNKCDELVHETWCTVTNMYRT